jgi:hypothetical protein
MDIDEFYLRGNERRRLRYERAMRRATILNGAISALGVILLMIVAFYIVWGVSA